MAGLETLSILLYYIMAVAGAAAISIYTVRKIIFISRKRKIYDIPDDIRKIHGAEIPTLGGIGIFIGYIIAGAFFWRFSYHFMPYILASSSILFFTGIYDDIMNMRPSKKLVVQLLASFITVYLAGIRIQSLYGLFGVNDIAYWPGIILTTLSCTFFINVFNFIDGIDGLAGVLAVLYLGTLGCLFATAGTAASGITCFSFAGTCFAITGATIGLLFYNITPAKIYMGDTGSMFLGFTIFIFSVLFLNWCNGLETLALRSYISSPQNAVVLIFAMLFLPVFDAIRVFILRASKGISPLKADRAHLHYYLLDAGFTHTQSVLIIVSTNIGIMILVYLLQDLSAYINLLSITILASVVLLIVYTLRQKKLRNKKS